MGIMIMIVVMRNMIMIIIVMTFFLFISFWVQHKHKKWVSFDPYHQFRGGEEENKQSGREGSCLRIAGFFLNASS